MIQRVSDEFLQQQIMSDVGVSYKEMARELIEARKAAKYVQHLPFCISRSDNPYWQGRCDCGLSDLPEYIRNGE